MPPSPGQQLALEQLSAIAELRPDALEIISTSTAGDPALTLVSVSLKCEGIVHGDAGITVRSRERFLFLIDADFPFSVPTVMAQHRRWSGHPHVQWTRQLCLYLSADSEWQPTDGMYGYLDRLANWLERAAVGALDPVGAPAHPPVAYAKRGARTLLARADTPPVGDGPWLGWAELAPKTHRSDLVAWGEELEKAPPGAACAVLLSEPMDFEFPGKVSDLLLALESRGVRRNEMLVHMQRCATGMGADEELCVIIGSPSRGIVGDEPKTHLAAWSIVPLATESLAISLPADGDPVDLAEARKRLEISLVDWLETTEVAWCHLLEDRPEIVNARDAGSSMTEFKGKSVALWGCGAVGAHVAEWLVRAGVSRIVLRDKAIVKPGILSRQPFVEDDIGGAKARILADRLGRIDPTVTVTYSVEDIRKTILLDPAGWDDGCEMVIDATASNTVTAQFEELRRRSERRTLAVRIFLGHTAEHGIAVACPPTYSGGPLDAVRQLHLRCCNKPALKDFKEEFWPDPPRTEYFQPEPGCSEPTFTGSAVDVVAVTARLMHRLAERISADDGSASAVLVDLCTDRSHQETRYEAFLPATPLSDGINSYEIRLSADAQADIDSIIARDQRLHGPESETGGVMYGTRNDAARVIWVDEISGPPPDSSLDATEFVCGVDGVESNLKERRVRTSGELGFLGMWHTHPVSSPYPSLKDVETAIRLVGTQPKPLPFFAMLIVGHTTTSPSFGAYVFSRQQLLKPLSTIEVHPKSTPSKPVLRSDARIGLALSGGGSRAIAFHLGCLRALNERGILARVSAVSCVSGGSVIGALWAFSEDEFDEFEARVQAMLAKGLAKQLIRQTLLSRRAPEAIASRAAMRSRRLAAAITGNPSQPRRVVTRTDALSDVLRDEFFDEAEITDVLRDNLDVVINACDLRTGAAAKFGSRESGVSRLGRISPNDISVANVVAASAAYPLLLPAMDRDFNFREGDDERAERTVLTDGGVYDNLAIQCFDPNQDPSAGYNAFDVNYVIACDAGAGVPQEAFPANLPARMKRVFAATHRKAQDASRSRLHALAVTGELDGFAMPYLGQRDARLPRAPSDLVRREQVASYPTNFSAMSELDIGLLGLRGEQLTRILIARWCPEL